MRSKAENGPAPCRPWRPRPAHAGRAEPLATTSRERQRLALAGPPVLDLDLAGGDAARPDDHLPGQADQVGGGELAARPLVGVVVEHVLARRRQRRIELAADAVALGVAAPSC